MKLQGKHQLVNKLFEHICAFEKKLELLRVQLGRATLTHFTCLAARKMEFPDFDSTNNAVSAQKLCDEFTSRFPEFRRDEIKVKLFAYPFDLAVDDSLDDCQMELIELTLTPRGDILKIVWWTFANSVCGKFTNLSHRARKMIFLFGSTYCCEQFFKKMKLTKTRCQSRLTDEHLTRQLRVATTSVKADIDKLCKD